MKRIKGLFGLGAAVAAALTLGACSQDETAGGDGALCPMELTATGLEPMVTPMTRATVDGDWDKVTKVAVQVGSEVKEYTVTPSADKKTATLTSNDPFYWPASGSVTVSAWPYNDDTTKPAVEVKSDQSGDGYAASDFIEAVAQTVTKDNNALEFTHRTAKIRVRLTAADGSNLTGAVVSIAVGGQTVEKCFNSASDGGHFALIAPTAAAEELTVKIAAGGKNYVYKHTAVKYDANSQYTFNLKVMNGEAVALSGCTITGWANKLTVNNGEAEEDPGFTKDADGTYHVTSAAGLKAWAEAVAGNDYINCVLENDIVMPTPEAGESNWTPIGTFKGTFDGNGKTITGLVVNKGARSDAGFIVLNYGTVKNLTLKDAEITGTSTVGAVAVVNFCIIENCHVTGASEITGGIGNQVGGVVSMNYATILACHVAKGCKVSGKNQVGGIAGDNYKEITGCYALCSLTGSDAIGGISGCCYESGSTTSSETSFTACYSKCSYGSGSSIGGIVGYDPDGAAYSACYWLGDENCGNGVGYGMNNNPSGVTKIGGETTWATACGKMNEVLAGTDYQYEVGTTADEPLVLKEKQQ